MSHKEQLYYQELLSQYIAGTISKEDRFELEKYALEDLFMFDAIEGIHQDSANKTAVINRLKQQIQTGSEKKKGKRIPLLNYGIAASLILLLGAGIWFFRQVNGSEEMLADKHTDQIKTETQQNETIVLETQQTGSVIEIEDIPPSKPEVADQNNQYNSPKASISTKADDEIVPTSSTTQLSNTEETKQQTPPLSKRLNQENVVKLEKAKIEDMAMNEGEVKTSAKSSGLPTPSRKQKSKPTDNFDNTDLEETTDMATEAVIPELTLAREEYVQAIEDNILVAPQGGINSFRQAVKGASQKFKNIAEDSDDKIIVKFMITKDGQPSDFDIISGTDQDCINRIISQLKYGATWISSPPKSESNVKLEIPCY